MATKKNQVSVSMKCISVQLQEKRATVIFADDVKNTERGLAANSAITVQLQDSTQAASFVPGTKYTIDIYE